MFRMNTLVGLLTAVVACGDNAVRPDAVPSHDSTEPTDSPRIDPIVDSAAPDGTTPDVNDAPTDSPVPLDAEVDASNASACVFRIGIRTPEEVTVRVHPICAVGLMASIEVAINATGGDALRCKSVYPCDGVGDVTFSSSGGIQPDVQPTVAMTDPVTGSSVDCITH